MQSSRSGGFLRKKALEVAEVIEVVEAAEVNEAVKESKAMKITAEVFRVLGNFHFILIFQIKEMLIES